MPKLIPLSALQGACFTQLAIVTKLWPNGIPITMDIVPQVIRLGLDLDWAAHKLLTAPALNAYNKAIATALDAYKKAIATALDAYKKAIATALDAYDKARATAADAYKKAIAT